MNDKWQEYVPNLQASGHVKKVGIFGHDGTKRAATTDLKISASEIAFILAAIQDPKEAQVKGVKLEGITHILLRSSDRSLYVKRGPGGWTIAVTKTAVIFASYEPPIIPGQNALTVERVATYLLNNNF
jgi:hypothetical protein